MATKLAFLHDKIHTIQRIDLGASQLIPFFQALLLPDIGIFFLRARAGLVHLPRIQGVHLPKVSSSTGAGLADKRR